jgi:hypothetical protein
MTSADGQLLLGRMWLVYGTGEWEGGWVLGEVNGPDSSAGSDIEDSLGVVEGGGV